MTQKRIKKATWISALIQVSDWTSPYNIMKIVATEMIKKNTNIKHQCLGITCYMLDAFLYQAYLIFLKKASQ